jgi:hypothetical protein
MTGQHYLNVVYVIITLALMNYHITYLLSPCRKNIEKSYIDWYKDSLQIVCCQSLITK